MKKISVCVPAYNRPDTLEQLIHSFIKQDYPNKELVISDDSPNNSIAALVKKYPKRGIRYVHNTPGLGFAFNLLHSLTLAKGDVIVILGDDDVFFSKKSLQEYVLIFDKHPSVSYVYTNAVQFSENLNIELEYKHFAVSTIYKKGDEAMRHMWLSSLFIGGMGLRNNINFPKLYPKENILYPQVALVGHILNQFDGYANASNLVAARSHDDQIIFRALKDKQLRGEGDHTNVEFLKIFKMLKKKYGFSISEDFLENYLISHHSKMIFKEKAIIGRKLTAANYNIFIKASKKASTSVRLRIAFLLSMIFPNWLIWSIKKNTLGIIHYVHSAKFSSHQKKLLQMIS